MRNWLIIKCHCVTTTTYTRYKKKHGGCIPGISSSDFYDSISDNIIPVLSGSQSSSEPNLQYKEPHTSPSSAAKRNHAARNRSAKRFTRQKSAIKTKQASGNRNFSGKGVSKNNPTCENAVTRKSGSGTFRVMDFWFRFTLWLSSGLLVVHFVVCLFVF